MQHDNWLCRLLGKATQQNVLLYSCSIAIRVRSLFWGWTSRLGSAVRCLQCAVLGLSKQVAGLSRHAFARCHARCQASK